MTIENSDSEEVTRLKLERDVYKAILEGMEFNNLDKIVDVPNPIEFAKKLGSLSKDIILKRK